MAHKVRRQEVIGRAGREVTPHSAIRAGSSIERGIDPIDPAHGTLAVVVRPRGRERAPSVRP